MDSMNPAPLRVVLLALAIVITADARAQSYNEVFGIVQPIGPGQYPVGCSNVEQDTSDRKSVV